MNTEGSKAASGSLAAWAGEGCACIKVVGRLPMHLSQAFKDLVIQLNASGHSTFLVDLTECRMADSTFIGTLSGFASKRTKTTSPVRLFLLNPTGQPLETFEVMGILHLFEVRHGPPWVGEPLAPVERAPLSRSETFELVAQAHENLVAINPLNMEKFRHVIGILAEEAKRSA